MTDEQKAKVCREQALDALREGDFDEYRELMAYADELEGKRREVRQNEKR